MNFRFGKDRQEKVKNLSLLGVLVLPLVSSLGVAAASESYKEVQQDNFRDRPPIGGEANSNDRYEHDLAHTPHEEHADSEPERVTGITQTRVRMRSTADVSSPSLGLIEQGQTLQIDRRYVTGDGNENNKDNDIWVYVTTTLESGQTETGWVAQRYQGGELIIVSVSEPISSPLLRLRAPELPFRPSPRQEGVSAELFSFAPTPSVIETLRLADGNELDSAFIGATVVEFANKLYSIDYWNNPVRDGNSFFCMTLSFWIYSLINGLPAEQLLDQMLDAGRNSGGSLFSGWVRQNALASEEGGVLQVALPGNGAEIPPSQPFTFTTVLLNEVPPVNFQGEVVGDTDSIDRLAAVLQQKSSTIVILRPQGSQVGHSVVAIQVGDGWEVWQSSPSGGGYATFGGDAESSGIKVAKLATVQDAARYILAVARWNSGQRNTSVVTIQ